jgi:mRNA interferase MazF
VEAVKQYEIWWAELPKPAGRRPVLLLSRDDAYGVLNKFVAAEITATVRHIPIEVPLGSIEGMSKPCVVNCDNLRTISKAHLVKKISKLSQKRIHEVKSAVGYALGWEELIAAGE